MINLDYASHTQASEAALAEFCRVERDCGGNALAMHKNGRVARTELECAREGIATLAGVKSTEIIFTSGASEANNLAVKGIARTYAHAGRHVLSTCLEHPSVSGALAFLGEVGYEIELLKILPNGKIDLSHLRSTVRKDTILLCVSAVDSELGAIQPLGEIAEIVEAFPNCYLHVDAAQAVGKIPMLPCHPSFSTLCFSPHKFHGLGGFGVLVKCEGVVLEPLIHGGSEANGLLYRGGTPSPAAAASCFVALRDALSFQTENLQTVSQLREYALEGLRRLEKKIRINSPLCGSPYILNLSATGIKGTAFQSALDERGIFVSVKSTCSTDNAPSRPVFAVSGDKKNALNSWRVSFSHFTTCEEVDIFLAAVNEVLRGA